MSAARQTQQAVLSGLRELVTAHLDVAGLAALIAAAPDPVPLRYDHHVYTWCDHLRWTISHGNRDERRAAFGELAKVVFHEAGRQGPDGRAAAWLHVLASVVQEIDSPRPFLLGAMVHEVSCEACGWHPSISDERRNAGAQR